MAVTMAKRKQVHPVIRRLRKLRGELSQAEFARRLGINVWTLRGWEQGRSNPDSTTLSFISLYIDCHEKLEK